MAIGNALSNLFGQSPIKPLQQHMAKVHECAEALASFFQSTLDKDWQKAATERQKTTTLEHQADELKKSIRLHLPKSLFLPVPRGDLLELLSVQDNIANIARDITGLMLGRQMTFPASMQATMSQYLDASIKTSAQALKAICELDELIETGFSNREAEHVDKLILELDDLEKTSDELQIEVRSQLFALEKELPPVDVIFLYKIIDRIGELADDAERVGSRLQILIAR